MSKNKVAVGLSGGVDSTATAYILKKEGYDVIGITMIVCDEYDKDCNVIEPKFVKDAKRIAKILDIPHYIVDYKDIFKITVKKEFEEEYLKGRTPNPCVTCNRIIKYGKLIETAHSLGAYYIATGHYATIRYDKELKRYRIFKGVAERKDQAYNLYSLSQEQLKHILLPLGKFNSKEEVRKLAFEIDPMIAKKNDSTGICFVPNEDHISYLTSVSSNASKSGNFVDKTGKIIGKHKGIVYYTIGQKRGLGINCNRPMFVVAIDAEKNEIVLGEDQDTYSIGLIAKNVNFTLFDKLEEELRVEAKVCQWGWFLPATVFSLGKGWVKVIFDKKERAIAPGQSVVFYHGNEVIGGGIIESVIKE
ncbi:tRNA 2-thiouridine(34) synthase MnmA [Crassaminicella indica]|uniref:tRNA-specific 2-thiouridylase MnmA n=1 Tax=Crassaminicella indica TaxID=2855394 RepID=A0ABX8R9E0_9CLOT|nr:tRNA 2-thiouridine(34) synthase MnmA [Crassaminicella indica]QXM05628.1 tRNA 2-thiouridine(34) synthase MnmA [Crassaminicella indica]